MRDTPWGKMTYLDYKYKVEFGHDEYDEIYTLKNFIKNYLKYKFINSNININILINFCILCILFT